MREWGLAVFRGIPYMAAPVGERRWRATEPHPGWMVVRDATVYGPIAPQPIGLPHDEMLGTQGRSADFFEVDQYPVLATWDIRSNNGPTNLH